jgi:iron-sulfur cluster assembly accessory protein
MITLTKDAITELRSMLAADTAAEKGDGLRLAVERGGCAGMQYQMKIDHRNDDDSDFETDGVHVYVDPESLTFLDGCEVDYSTELSDTGFKIRNPNASRSCGCGTSFEPDSPAEEANEPALDGTACGDTKI